MINTTTVICIHTCKVFMPLEHFSCSLNYSAEWLSSADRLSFCGFFFFLILDVTLVMFFLFQLQVNLQQPASWGRIIFLLYLKASCQLISVGFFRGSTLNSSWMKHPYRILKTISNCHHSVLNPHASSALACCLSDKTISSKISFLQIHWNTKFYCTLFMVVLLHVKYLSYSQCYFFVNVSVALSVM